MSKSDAVLMVSDIRATISVGIRYEAKKIHAVVTADGGDLGIVGGAVIWRWSSGASR